MAITSAAPSAWGVFRHGTFARYWLARFASAFAVQILATAVAWQVYDLTRDPLDLGLVGLLQFLPALLLVLVTGAVADRYSRRLIMGSCLAGEAAVAAAMFALTFAAWREVAPIFALLFVFGVVRAFVGPATNALVVNLVPADELATAIAWNSSSWQLASITGPVAGGLLYDLDPLAAYAASFALAAGGAALVFSLPRTSQGPSAAVATPEAVVAGFRYIFREKAVLGAISLDLFAVLLGGAVALLPVYARDILELDAWGLGLLRASPGIGALVTALILANYPIRDHAGAIMFVCVALFGLANAVFGLSTAVWLSVLALMLAGAFDMVSVYVRETLIQLWTPDALRGRVNAVNMVFVGASNELGEFRAGVMAAGLAALVGSATLGAVLSVTFGGVAAIGVAGLWAWLFPELRRARHLDARAPAER